MRVMVHILNDRTGYTFPRFVGLGDFDTVEDSCREVVNYLVANEFTDREVVACIDSTEFAVKFKDTVVMFDDIFGDKCCLVERVSNVCLCY